MFPFTKIKAQQLEDLPIDATGLAVQSHLNFAGGKNVQADQLATVEACVGLYARCFARAQVSGDAPASLIRRLYKASCGQRCCPAMPLRR